MKITFDPFLSEVWVPGMGLESPWIPQPSLPHTRWERIWLWINKSMRWRMNKSMMNMNMMNTSMMNMSVMITSMRWRTRIDYWVQVRPLLREHRWGCRRHWQLPGGHHSQHVSQPLSYVDKSDIWNFLDLEISIWMYQGCILGGKAKTSTCIALFYSL